MLVIKIHFSPLLIFMYYRDVWIAIQFLKGFLPAEEYGFVHFN